MRQLFFFLTLLSLAITSCNSPGQKTNDPLSNTIYSLGRKTDSTSTGPLANSAFVMKINDSLPALLLTAHHAVAGVGEDQYLRWDELESEERNRWAWSMTDSTYDFKVGRNLPIQDAETLQLDLAAFYLPSDDVPFLRPASQAAVLGDTVYLFSKMTHEGKVTFRNRGVVTYVTDSVMVYELTDFNKNVLGMMTGTSGSCVLNKNNEVIANSYGGLAIPNEEIKKQMAMGYPLLNKLNTKYGVAYGIGVPIPLIQKSIIEALKNKN